MVVQVVPEAVRRLAEHPFVELDVPPGFEKIERERFLFVRNPFPSAQVVEPKALAPGDVAEAVEEARAIAREAEKSLVAWWVAPEDDALAEPLERLGLRNQDTPGFEAIENAMVLLEAPAGSGGEDVEVREQQTYEEFRAAMEVTLTAFEAPPEMREEILASAADRWAEACIPGNPGRGFVAFLDGRVVGAATAALGAAGVNLFGGAVLPDARGCGVYRALTHARWQMAVDRGTPALTIQAGRMSRPIAERLGFRKVSEIRVFVDEL
jgi:GNAT superfamily N-acetyltransferase